MAITCCLFRFCRGNHIWLQKSVRSVLAGDRIFCYSPKWILNVEIGQKVANVISRHC